MPRLNQIIFRLPKQLKNLIILVTIEQIPEIWTILSGYHVNEQKNNKKQIKTSALAEESLRSLGFGRALGLVEDTFGFTFLLISNHPKKYIMVVTLRQLYMINVIYFSPAAII